MKDNINTSRRNSQSGNQVGALHSKHIRERNDSHRCLLFWHITTREPCWGDVANNPYGDRFVCDWIAELAWMILEGLVDPPSSGGKEATESVNVSLLIDVWWQFFNTTVDAHWVHAMVSAGRSSELMPSDSHCMEKLVCHPWSEKLDGEWWIEQQLKGSVVPSF